MGAVLSGGLQMVKNLLPGQVGTNKRWTDQYVQAVIVAADRAVRERCDLSFREQEITLANDDYAYNLDAAFISIEKVEFASDGTNYNFELVPRTMTDLDQETPVWRTCRGTRPEAYALLSAPGVQTLAGEDPGPSQIYIYPAISTVSAQTIMVTGVGAVPTGAFLATASVGDDVLMKCHVPYTLSVLYAQESPDRAVKEFGKYLDGCRKVRGRFVSPLNDRPSRGRRP